MIGEAGADTCKNAGDLILPHQLGQQWVQAVQPLDDDHRHNLPLHPLQSLADVEIKDRDVGLSLLNQLLDAAVDPLNIQRIDAFKVRLALTI